MDIKRVLIYSVLFMVAVALSTLGFQAFGSEGLLIPMGLTFAYFTSIFIVASFIKNNSIVDIGWGMAFVIGSAAYTLIKFNTGTFNPLQWIILGVGFGLALLGLFFEVVGDEPLRVHIQKGTRTLLQSGLWSITRDPNYFGEIMIWNGLYIAGLSLWVDGSVSIIY